MATDRNEVKALPGEELPPACLPVAELLAAWVDGGLQGDEARLVTRHVAQCARCEAEAQSLREVLADLHTALALDRVDGRDPEFWRTMAANIEAAIDHAPQMTAAMEASNVVALPVRRWRTVLWALSGALAAAVLAVFAVHMSADPAGQPQQVTAAPHWTDALQARMSIEDDPASGDGDPIDDLEDLNDDEVQELATQLGEEG